MSGMNNQNAQEINGMQMNSQLQTFYGGMPSQGSKSKTKA